MSARVRGNRNGGPMWLAEALDTAPSMPVVPALASNSKVCLCGTHMELARFAGPTAELATPCVTYYQKSKDRRPSGDSPAGTSCPESPEALSTGPPIKPGLDKLAREAQTQSPPWRPGLSRGCQILTRLPGWARCACATLPARPHTRSQACRGACAVAVSGPRGRVLPRSPPSPALARAVLPRPSRCPRHGPQLRLRCAR